MANFFTLLTTVGSNRLANALVQGETVDFHEMALGDGNGNPVTPVESMTELTNEVHRTSMNSITVDSENANQIICEMIVPAATGGWFIREVGIFATDGTLLAVGNFPETYKPTLVEGSGRDLIIRIILLVNNAGIVNLVINPDTVIASQSYVAEQIASLKLYSVGDTGISFTDTKPPGSLWIDGSELPADAAYDALNTYFNGTYGTGSGGRSYLPPAKGYFLRVTDGGAGIDPDAATRTDRGDGTSGDNVGTLESDELESHTHDVPLYEYTSGETDTFANGIAPSNGAGSVNAAGGSETRPKNINIRLYIYY